MGGWRRKFSCRHARLSVPAVMAWTAAWASCNWLASIMPFRLRGFVDAHVGAASVAGGHHGAFQHFPGKVHQGMVENAVFKAGGVDQALFGVVDLESAEFAVGQAGSADVVAEAVEVSVEVLQEGLYVAAVAFAFGGFVEGGNEVFAFGNGFKGDQGAFHRRRYRSCERC